MPGRIIVVLLTVFLISFGSLSAQAVEKKTGSAIVILPFDVNAAGKYSYLKDSLRNMLASRLAVRDGIRVLDSSLTQKEIAEVATSKKEAPPQHLFARLHADYIVTGVLSSKADELDVQVTFHPYSGAGRPLMFKMSADKEENILSSLDRLTLEIGDKVSGTPVARKAEGEKMGEQKPPTPGPVDSMAAFRTPHPERLYRTGLYSGGSIVSAENSGSGVSSEGVRKSTPISMKMVAMAVGDLDGDGIQEIVLAEDGDLRIMHFKEGRFLQIAKASLPARLKIHAMNIADPDKSGRMKIYISATDGNSTSSLVAAWSKEHGLQTLHKNIRWYLRPMEIPGEGMVLVGQEKGFEDNMLVLPGMYELTIPKGSDIPKRGKKLSLPKSVNLFDFTLADLNGDGKVETLVIDRNEKLSVYDQAGALLWISNDNFGGSINYLGPRWTNPALIETRVFVPTRIIVTDMNHDNKKEIVIGRNQRGSYSYNFFKNSRWYDGGYVSCLTWTGSAMAELWHTNSLAGMIADYSFRPGFSDMGVRTGSREEGRAEMERNSGTLFIGQIPDSNIFDKMLPESSESYVLAYGIDFVKKRENK